MGQISETQRPHSFRSRLKFAPRCRTSVIIIRAVAILLFLALLHRRHLYFTYRDALRAKYSPTEFAVPPSAIWTTQIADAGLPQILLDHRAQWKVLGEGWEGQTFVFNGSVIKTFVPGRSPFRNCVQGDPTMRYPTEIPASLQFGGIWTPTEQASDDRSMNVTDSVVQIVPVKAYFMVPSNAAEWHLVTPYLPGGNLNNLANKIKEQHRYGDIREIDAAFRPSFHKFLRTLEWLHGRGFCHDDVKLANIFIDEDGNWVLGDLGNIRHVNHPYHSSRIWLQDNKQLADCRANDAFRALKTYLQFLRRATNDGISFDVEFFKRKHGFSRLYWRAITDSASMSAAGIRGLSETLDPRQLPYDRARETPVLGLGRRRALSNAVNEALRTMLSERTARLAALTWIFGVPVGEC